MMLISTLLQAAHLQLARALTPDVGLAMLPGKLNKQLENSSLRDDAYSCELIKNFNYQVPTTKELTISNIQIDTQAADAIAGAVADNTAITTASLVGTGLTAQNAKTILCALKTCPNITTIDFSQNTFTPQEIVDLVKELKSFPQLETLKLNHTTALGDAGAFALAALITLVKPLQRLEILGDPIPSAGRDALNTVANSKSDFRLLMTTPTVRIGPVSQLQRRSLVV